MWRRVLAGLTVLSAVSAGGGPAGTSAPVFAESAEAAEAGAGAGPGWVVGRVVDHRDRPVAGALVNVLGPRWVPERGLVEDETDRRAWTDAEGRFRVRQDPAGYLVQVCEPDPRDRTVCQGAAQGVAFVITYAGGSGVTDSWVLQQQLFEAGATRRNVGDIAVGRPGRVVGAIAGAPTGAEVRVMRLNDTLAFRTWTEEGGSYRVAGLVPGEYYLATGGSGHLPWRSDPIRVTAGTSTRVDGRLDRGAAIVGTLRSSGTPVAGVDAWVRRAGAGVLAVATSDRQGRIRVSGLEPGRYRISVEQGSGYLPVATTVEITEADQTLTPVVALTRGATIRLRVRTDTVTGRVIDELRDARGRVIQSFGNDGSGLIEYHGLPAGRYTVMVADADGYASRTVRVGADRTVRLGTLDPARPLVALTGRTTPRAVVEATTGDFCPPDGRHRYGAVHEIQRADAAGRYRIPGLVPGRYMLGADHWPADHAPRCVSDVQVRAGTSVDLPLEQGAVVTGRLVYAGTGDPVITPLSYQLAYPQGLPTNPTEEHPARGRTVRDSGRFTIPRLAAGEVLGRLATEAGDLINHPSFFVTFPFQDGTPYWLDTAAAPVRITAGGRAELGDVEVVTHGAR